MTVSSMIQAILFVGLLGACVKPLGLFMAAVYLGRNHVLARVFGRAEAGIYRVCGIDPDAEMTWRQYSMAVVMLSVVSICAVYGLQRFQGVLP